MPGTVGIYQIGRFFSPVDALIRIGRIVINLAGISQARYMHARYVGCVGTVKSSLSSCHRARMAKMTVGAGCCRRLRGRCIHRKPRLLMRKYSRGSTTTAIASLRTSDPHHSRTDARAFALAGSLPQAGTRPDLGPLYTTSHSCQFFGGKEFRLIFVK